MNFLVALFKSLNIYAAALMVLFVMAFASCTDDEHGPLGVEPTPSTNYQTAFEYLLETTSKDSTHHEVKTTINAKSTDGTKLIEERTDSKSAINRAALSISNEVIFLDKLSDLGTPKKEKTDSVVSNGVTKYTQVYTYENKFKLTNNYQKTKLSLKAIDKDGNNITKDLVVGHINSSEKGYRALETNLKDTVYNGKVYTPVNLLFNTYNQHDPARMNTEPTDARYYDADLYVSKVVYIYKNNWDPEKNITDWKIVDYTAMCDKVIVNVLLDYNNAGTYSESATYTTSKYVWTASSNAFAPYFVQANNTLAAFSNSVSNNAITNDTDETGFGYTNKANTNTYGHGSAVNTASLKYTTTLDLTIGGIKKNVYSGKEPTAKVEGLSHATTSTGTTTYQGKEYDTYPVSGMYFFNFQDCEKYFDGKFAIIVEQVKITWEWAINDSNKGLTFVTGSQTGGTDNSWAYFYKKWSNGDKTDEKKLSEDIYNTFTVASRQQKKVDNFASSYSAKSTAWASSKGSSRNGSTTGITVDKYTGRYEMSIDNVSFNNPHSHEIPYAALDNQKFEMPYATHKFSEVNKTFAPVAMSDETIDGVLCERMLISVPFTRTFNGKTYNYVNELVVYKVKKEEPITFETFSAFSIVRLKDGTFVRVAVAAANGKAALWTAAIGSNDWTFVKTAAIDASGVVSISANNFLGDMTFSGISSNANSWLWTSCEVGNNLGSATGSATKYIYQTNGFYIDGQIYQVATFSQNTDGTYKMSGNDAKGACVVNNISASLFE